MLRCNSGQGDHQNRGSAPVFFTRFLPVTFLCTHRTLSVVSGDSKNKDSAHEIERFGTPL